MIHLRLAALLSIMLGLLSFSLPADHARASTQSTRQELKDAAESIDAYWQAIFASYDFDYFAPELAFEQGEFDAPCKGEAEFAAYCGQDETIYLDARQIDLVSKQAGELLPAVLLAHEWGHHLTMLLLPYDGSGVDLEWVDKDWEIEVLADCFSGVYIGELWYDDELQEGDVSDSLAFMSAIGDPTHGTGDDRIVGFMHGFVEGFEGCDVLASS